MEGIYALADPSSGSTMFDLNNEFNLFGLKTHLIGRSFQAFEMISDAPVEKEIVKEEKGSILGNFFIGLAVTAALGFLTVISFGTAPLIVTACLAGAAVGAAVVTTSATVTDLERGEARDWKEFVGQLASGVLNGAVTGAFVYGLWTFAPAVTAGLQIGLVNHVSLLTFSKIPLIVNIGSSILMGGQAARLVNNSWYTGSGRDYLFENVFNGNESAYSAANLLLDLATYGYIDFGIQNAPIGGTRGSQYAGKPKAVEGQGKTPVQGDPDFVGPLTSKDFGRLEIIPGNEPYSQSELNAARYMAEQGNDVILRPPTGTRLDGGTSDLLVNGINYDVYTPKTTNVSRIVGGVAAKNSQTTGVVLDLSQTSVTADELTNILPRVQGSIRSGGKQVNITDIVIMPK